MINLTSLSQVRAVVSELGLHPSKALGQNFLIDRNILDILVDAAELSADDVVLEVGPGLGVLTERLVAVCRRVIAVEKDGRLCDFLRQRLEGEKRLELIHGDMLEWKVESLPSGTFSRRRGTTDYTDGADADAAGRGDEEPGRLIRVNKVVSNLPYSVGTRILVDVVTAESPVEHITVTLQEEVAGRLAAAPGSRDYGMVSAWAQLAYGVERVKRISPGCFWPRPEVSSSIVRLKRRPEAATLDLEARRGVYGLTRLAFAHRRKQLASILAGVSKDGAAIPVDEFRQLLEELGIPGNARPENLSPGNWVSLNRHVRVL